jgi:hypothetical protein
MGKAAIEWTLSGALCLIACGSPAAKLAKPPEYAPKGETKCSVVKSQSSPLIVEWPSSERARLESMTKSGLVAVRYVGCEMQTLPNCRVRAKYRYTALTPKRDQMRITSQDELYASMPIHAASFEGKLEQAGELNVSMTIVGRFEAESSSFDAGILEGECREATHVVSAITTGAFRFFAGAGASTAGGASVLGAGVGTKSSASEETLAHDGNESACSGSSAADSAPPFECGALIRLEVTPITAGTPSPRPKVAEAKPAPSSKPAEKPVSLPTAARGSRYSVAVETVVDSTTKLTWQRMPEDTGMTWEDAKTYCSGLRLGDTGGFRLPTKAELLGLGENLPAGIDRNAFPAAVDKERDNMSAVVFYWTSTPHPVSESMAWGVRFGTMGAQAVIQSRSSPRYVRCVK